MLPGMRETAVIPPCAEALPAGANWKRCQLPPSYQKASCTDPSGPIHQTSMLFGMRETAVMPPCGEALPGGASWKICQVPPSYQ
jgi:hypothetical protein